MTSNKRVFLQSIILAAAVLVAAPTTRAKSMLWKTSKGGEVMYLQGSAHVLTEDCYPLAPAIEQAYSNATALVFEVDMAEMTSPKTQQLILSKAMFKRPDTLKTALDAATYEKLENACVEAGLPMAAMEQFKPWFATMSVALVKMQQLGLNPNLGLDKHFHDRATKDGKKVVGLESIDFQIALFDSLSNENPNDFVNRSLADLTALKEDVKALLAAWESGDLAAMEKLLKKSFNGYPDLYDKFITARNKTWVKKFSKMIKDDETYMVVVGAGHLSGEEGVINLLKKKGFQVEQL